MNLTVLRNQFQVIWAQEFDASAVFDTNELGVYPAEGMQAAWLIFKAAIQLHEESHKVGANGLKHCPYCGADAERYPDGDMEGYSVMCSGKHAIFGATHEHCPSGTFGYVSQQDADTAWNTRATL